MWSCNTQNIGWAGWVRYIFACLALQLLYQHPMLEQDEAGVLVAATVFYLVGLSHGGWMSLRSVIYSISIWRTAVVQRTWTLLQGLCPDSAGEFQCLGLWRGWWVTGDGWRSPSAQSDNRGLIVMSPNCLENQPFFVHWRQWWNHASRHVSRVSVWIHSAWLHSRWLVQHNDYVAADSWTHEAQFFWTGGFFRSRQRHAKAFKTDQDLIQRAALPLQLPPSSKPCICSCYSATLPEPSWTIQNTEAIFERGFGHCFGILALETETSRWVWIFKGSQDFWPSQGLYPLTTLILDALVCVGVW